MTSHHTVCAIFLIILLEMLVAARARDELRLVHRLLGGGRYDRRSRPVVNASASVLIWVDVVLNQIIDLVNLSAFCAICFLYFRWMVLLCVIL